MQGKRTKIEGGPEWRRVRLWFNGLVIADSTVDVDRAGKMVALYGDRFAKLRVTNEAASSPSRPYDPRD